MEVIDTTKELLEVWGCLILEISLNWVSMIECPIWMCEVDLMAGFDVFISGAFEELEEAHVAGNCDWHAQQEPDQIP